LLAIGSILFTISLPIIFDSSSVLTIAWSLEAAALVLFGIRLQSYAQRSIGLIIQVIVLSRVLFLGILSSTHLPGTVAFFNERFLTLLLVTVVTAIIGWIYYKNKDSVLASELVLIKIVPVLVGIQIFIFGSVEIFDFLAHYWLIAFWSILVFVVLTIGNLTKSKGLVNVGYFIMVINGIIFMAIGSGDGVKDAFINPYFNVVIFATIMGIISVLSLRAINKRDEGVGIESISFLSVYSYFAIIVAFSKEIIIYNYSYAFLPVVWSICAIILLVVAYYFKSKILRFTTYASVLISALYCFFEIINILNKTDYSLIFNYRFMAMFVVVVASSLIVYSIKSQEEVPDSEKESVSFLFSLAGSFLLLLAISQEVWGVVTRQIENAKGTSVRSLIQFRDVLLSITWAIYGSVAMMVGIYKRSRFFRLFGLILLGVVIFKVFFVDAAGLETIYKILAYITLGILLLVAGFLYNKYKDRIMDFVR
jgi:hypothetical protein